MFEKIKWIGILIFLIGIIYGSHKLSAAVMTSLLEEPKIVVVDAGHGGSDPGKVGVNQSLEKDLNLAIAKKVKDCLEKSGFQVIMTREKDEVLAEGKTEDLKKRTEIMNQSGAILAVSIHQNSFSGEAESGAQVFYYSESEEGEAVAQILQEALWKLETGKQRKKKENNTYYLLKNTKIPTIIVECGFLSNWEEAEKLVEEGYQMELAQAICDGIVKYIQSIPSGK